MKKYAIVLVYSLIIFFFYNVSLFVASVLSSSAEPNLHMSLITSIFILTITAFFSYLFRQSITISTLQLAIITTVFTIILVLLITIPNQTTVIFFSNWSVYLTFLSITVGTYLGKNFKSDLSKKSK